MPFSPKQMKSIRARKHGWKGKGAFFGVSKKKAAEMEAEGTKSAPDAAAQARALRKKS